MRVLAHGTMKEGGSTYNRIRQNCGEGSIAVIKKGVIVKGFFEWTSKENITYLIEGDAPMECELHDYELPAFKQISYSKWGIGHDSKVITVEGKPCRVFYLPAGVFTLLSHR
jgi:hypothetical protein